MIIVVKKKQETGALIAEILIAMGLFLSVVGSLTVLGTKSFISRYQSIDNFSVQNIVNAKYTELKKSKQRNFDNLASGTTEKRFNIEGRIFTLNTVISDVYRDNTSGKVVASSCSGCTVDSNYKRAVFTISWDLIQGNAAIPQVVVVYFSKWENQ